MGPKRALSHITPYSKVLHLYFPAKRYLRASAGVAEKLITLPYYRLGSSTNRLGELVGFPPCRLYRGMSGLSAQIIVRPKRDRRKTADIVASYG